jgi:hypothetical protein
MAFFLFLGGDSTGKKKPPFGGFFVEDIVFHKELS